MKKILSIILIVVAIISFSGLATADDVSAYSIKDKGSWDILSASGPMLGEYEKIYDWYLIYFDKNHCRFYFTKWKYTYSMGGTNEYNEYAIQHKENTYGHTVDFKRISKTNIKVSVKAYYKDTLKGTSSYTSKTTKTPYKLFKSKKCYYILAFGGKPNITGFS